MVIGKYLSFFMAAARLMVEMIGYIIYVIDNVGEGETSPVVTT